MKHALALALLALAMTACENRDALRERAEAERLAWQAIAIPADRAAVNGVTIGSSEAQVVAGFGKPEWVEPGFSEVEGKPSRTLNYDGLQIYLIGDEIYNLECHSKVCRTADGIRVGDPVDKVTATHGQVEMRQRGDGSDTLAYPVIDFDGMLIFGIGDGKVISITLFFDYV